MAKAMVKAMIKAKVIGIAVCGRFKGDDPNLSPKNMGLRLLRRPLESIITGTKASHGHGREAQPAQADPGNKPIKVWVSSPVLVCQIRLNWTHKINRRLFPVQRAGAGSSFSIAAKAVGGSGVKQPLAQGFGVGTPGLKPVKL